MEIHPLTPERTDDFFEFFDVRAFADNPYWKGCYCTFFHRPEVLSEEEARHRPRRKEQARILIRDGGLQGYLAYGEDGRVIGWCNANRKTAYARLGSTDPIDENVLSIVCFAIDPALRRRGIARALLERALLDAAEQGMRWVEAYPSARAKSASGHYHGPLTLFEDLGFKKVPGRKLVVRKALNQPMTDEPCIAHRS
jgi:GNAT superfamily N-acetyltransferase